MSEFIEFVSSLGEIVTSTVGRCWKALRNNRLSKRPFVLTKRRFAALKRRFVSLKARYNISCSETSFVSPNYPPYGCGRFRLFLVVGRLFAESLLLYYHYTSLL